ncbi:GNAT family N-acetyltransferase [Bacillus sp. JJ722]|uniref:GNAT family N-acetyltransferase n=1 Tax=Bacillus sp. JJ722 TaxID=3122973 RepID=UPI002FFD7EE9
MLKFKKINLEKHREKVLKFRKDSFIVSFGDAFGFGEDDDYLRWLQENIVAYPEGFILVEEDGELIGQLELSIREYEDRNIGYINLYYLIPKKRENGIGQVLHKYAKQFFKSNNVSEYHLRVSPTNSSAMCFYRILGMKEIGPEIDGKVIRMKGYL